MTTMPPSAEHTAYAVGNSHAQPEDGIRKKRGRGRVKSVSPPLTGEGDDGPSLLQIYMREVREIDMLSAEEERAIAVRMKAGDESARKRMIEANLRLVPHIARGYVNRGVAFADLIAEGNLGLLRAVERYEVDRGARFATYATNWIRAFVSRYLVLAGDHHTVRLPAHMVNAFGKIQKARVRLAAALERDPNVMEIAAEISWEVDQVEKVLSVVDLSTVSLDTPVCHDDETYTIEDILSDTEGDNPEQAQSVDDIKSTIERCLSKLTERQRIVIESRYGLMGREPSVLSPIAEQLNITTERVRQLERAAIQRLKKALDEEGLDAAFVLNP